MQTGSFSDSELKQAAGMVCNSMLEALPPPEECNHSFSAGFEDRMQGLINKEARRNKLRKALRGVAAAILVIVFCSGVWIATDADARAAMVNWLREVYEDSVVYQFFASETATPLPRYELTWIPEGFEPTDVVDNETLYSAVYKDKSGDKGFVFEYVKMQEGTKICILFLNPDTSYENVEINGVAAHFYPKSDPSDSNHLEIINEQAGIAFGINSNLEKSVILHIAEGITLANETK